IEISPGDYLKRAMEAEDLYVRNKLEYSESAYAAGVYFDLCFHRYSKNNGLKKLEPYFKAVWGRAVRTGTVAYFLGEKVQGITPKTAMMAGMLAHAGKLHLAAWFESQKYAEFEEKMDKQDIPVLGRMMLERDMFGVAQEDVGAHTLRYFDIFKSLAPAVANFREPYNLRGADPANHALAVTVHLADAMARTWKVPPDEKDPIFSEWSYPGLGALKIRRSTLIEVLKRAMTLK
ncbi:MAG TPA: HDOD domain-containing protein, partial [Bdellovibrionota bacterium]